MSSDTFDWVDETNSTTFQLYALGSEGSGERNGPGHDADAVFYVKLSDMHSVFKFRTPTTSMNGGVDISLNQAVFDASSNIQYYVFRKNWPTALKLNPSHAMLDRTESSGLLTGGGGGAGTFSADKSLLKHDFIRYIALQLFNTVHGVDLFQNEDDLLENITYYGEVARVGIMSVLDTVSTMSADITMSMDGSGNRYLTNSSTENTNISRELMRQIIVNVPGRLEAYATESGGALLSVPLIDNDTLNIKVVMEPSPNQHALTNVNMIPARTYNIKLIIKNVVSSDNGTANTAVSDSTLFSNGYPYTTNIQDISASNLSAAASVYADKSPPVAIPTIRYGYQGWYYTNSGLWVDPAPSTRNKINWYILPNANGITMAGDLRYVRLNIHLFNSVSTPFLTVYTQATGSGDSGGWYKSKRTYIIADTLVDNTNYCFYMNWNGYSILPFTVAHTNAALTLSNVNGSVIGSFGDSEVLFAYSLETNSNSAPGNVEFILSGSIIGERNSGGSITENEYGYIM
jgi:hypothetical protein